MRRGLAPLLAILPLLATAPGLSLGFAEPPGPPPAAIGTYAWPVDGPVIREFQAPPGPFAAGHRGIDIAAAGGTPVRAAQDGIVAFAGTVAGDLHVSIDHPDGVRTTYAFLRSVEVKRGAPVRRGQVVATVGPGHPGTGPPHLHFGARVAGVYIDPRLLLERRSLVGLIHLAPIEEGSG